jgi:hypothetical protein
MTIPASRVMAEKSEAVGHTAQSDEWFEAVREISAAVRESYELATGQTIDDGNALFSAIDKALAEHPLSQVTL